MADTEAEVRERFLKDVETHEMTVVLDQGLHRHLRFRRPGTYCMGFDLVTWPGFLAISGDMGEYVFQRLEDMFQFFRHPEGKLYINSGYWHEKCQAADRHGKVKEFSEARFKARVLERIADYCEGERDEDALRSALLEEVTDDVFTRLDSGEMAAREALGDVERKGRQVFEDFWEYNCDEYTVHYLWACHAIAWGVIQYDGRPAPSQPGDRP